jgi:osmotically-inducible protein OsmY
MLVGSVASRAQKKQAETDAWLNGVRAVDTAKLQVSRSQADLVKGLAYTPSGLQAAMVVRDALSYDPRVSVADINPLVSGSFVLLRGTVRSASAKLAAEDTARHVPGVVDVTNQLQVRAAPPRDDALLEQDIVNALSWCAVTRGLGISVRVQAGKVTLGGQVESASQRRHATRLIASIEGVRDVDDLLRVARPGPPHPLYRGGSNRQPLPPSTALLGSNDETAATIRRRLNTNPFVGGAAISVEVFGGIPTLNGTVQSTSQRMAATRSAYEAGAIFVDNRLLVEGVD